MKKKILGILSLICLLMFSVVLDAQALVVKNDRDIEIGIAKLRELSSKDMMTIVNKNDLVGLRYDSFVMTTLQYQRTVAAAAEHMQNVLNRVNLAKNSSDFSDTEKNMQINKLYQEANSFIFQVNSDTMYYIRNLQTQMPSVTYQQFYRKFIKYYNELALAEKPIKL